MGQLRESLRKHRPLKKSATMYDEDTGSIFACESSFLTQKRKEIKRDSKNNPRFPSNPPNNNPGPNHYSVGDPKGTNPPCYTFGAKEQEKVGGGRKAWASPYMRTSSPFHYKADYELKWPGPGQHFTKPTATSNTNLT